MQKIGRVFLIGAGPGDPELLTVKAIRLLKLSNVVVYDRLISPEILALVPASAKKILVGKSPQNHPVPQEKINEILVEYARKGLNVARLKGGDPLIFGRGAEEAMYLSEYDISVEYAPGITAVQGLSLSCGVPLTYRNIATSVQIITGHKQSNSPLDIDWQSLANKNNTLVVYMGVASIANIAENLIAAGLSDKTPVVAVANATTPREQKLFSKLGSIANDTIQAGLKPPTVFVIGNVVSHSIDFATVLAENLIKNTEIKASDELVDA